MNVKTLGLATLFSTLSFSILANPSTGESAEEQSNTMIGLLGLSSNSIYVEGEDKTRLIPFFAGRWGNIYLEGASLGYILAETESSSFSTAIELDSAFVDERDDSPALADMRELDSAFSASLNYQYEFDYGELGLSVAADVSGTHDGYKLSASYGYPMMLGRLMVTPKVSVEWVSEEINQYFYGVTSEDVKQGRPLYMPESGLNYSAGITSFYPITQQHSIMLFAEYQRYDDEVFNSPIVDERSATSFGLGYVYRF